jgi:hypothetical protein
MLERLYGVDIFLPSDATRERLERLMDELTTIVTPFDRLGELIVFGSLEVLPSVMALLKTHGFESEPCELLALSQSELPTFTQGALYTDYSIEAHSGYVYFDLALTAAFAVYAVKPEAEPAPALLQLEEHLIGTWKRSDGDLHLIDRQLMPLADRIARAYGCSTEWAI